MHELPLVFFTVLAQASAGLFILMTLNKLIIKRPDDKAMFVSGVISLVIVGVAGFSAILHLGQPFRAINALFGTGRSPMSNEIVSCSIYGGLLFAHLAVSYLRPQMTNAIKASRIATAIAGIALLVLIPKVYTIETIPQWNTSYTMIQMLLAAFTAGGALAMILQPNRINLVVTVLSVMLSVFILPSYLAFLSQTAPHMLELGMSFWNAKFALYVVAVALAVLAYRKNWMPLAIGSSAVLIIAELSGRIAFYDLWSINM